MTIALQFSSGIQTMHAGHREIHHHQVRIERCGFLDSVNAITCSSTTRTRLCIGLPCDVRRVNVGWHQIQSHTNRLMESAAIPFTA
jgi:hypothetical protein